MYELTESQKARHAIRDFKTLTDALALRGFYRPSGKFGKELEGRLKSLSPEIYGSMNDPRVVELKGLEYVIDRLPRGIEACTKIILTEESPPENSSFEKIEPLKRRRTAYRVSTQEICMVISRGISEIYDILTHMTFLFSEAKKIHARMKDDSDDITIEWKALKHTVKNLDKLDDTQLDQALWNLSIILGRSYQETKDTFGYLEENKRRYGSNNGLFSLIFHLGKLIEGETVSRENALVIYLQPSLMNIIGQQRYGRVWAEDIKNRLQSLDLLKRPIHIISANMHSVVNLVYGFAAIEKNKTLSFEDDLYRFIQQIRSIGEEINAYGETHGLTTVHDRSGTHIDCQIIDSARFESLPLHPEVCFALPEPDQEKPVIIVMDYAFGAQAFELMENLLKPVKNGAGDVYLNIQSISIMGKAGILTGKKGDIMLATAHVFEGTSDNYIFENDLHAHAFDSGVDVYTGPMVTVLGTSLQNRDVLHKFLEDWKTVGLEMEGGHYQRAISAAIIKGNISKDITLRYAYYGSDNPLMTGHTLAAGAMGEEGVKPTYMITKILLEKIFCT
ncbi:MAG: hypothetical protein JRE21_01100 [Deltaproteobacteria bacterium]|jgi:hypothetical protein|nr:hypothetical protein [Deltaproteobacteria bacterium]